MKKIVCIVLSVVVLTACDKVKNPIQNPNAVTNCNTTPHVVKTNTVVASKGNCYYRKVLVEDYTGHTCGNCPGAARNLENKEGIYKDSLIVMAVHANGYSVPYPPHYPYDFRTPSGTEWDAALLINGTNPRFCINRAQSPFAQSPGVLASLIPSNLRKPQTAQLDVTTYLDTVKYYLNVKVKTTFKTAWPNSVKLVLVMVQDSIIGHQKDYSPIPSAALCYSLEATPDFETVCNYVFNHVCRGTINGTWGDLVKGGPISMNDTITKQSSCFKVNPFENKMSDVKHMSVIAFVYDDVTKEILQAEKVHIK